jgi:hypothetical protein
MEEDVALVGRAPADDSHRGRAAYLYGLIVSGAVLATASDDYRLVRVAVLLVVTLGIYWAAETYVHWIAARTHLQRDLTSDERWKTLRDGWPLMTACATPLLCLGIEAILGFETAVALDVTLAINGVLLFLVGWQMGKAGGMRGLRLVLSAVAAGLLGLSLIALKALMH